MSFVSPVGRGRTEAVVGSLRTVSQSARQRRASCGVPPAGSGTAPVHATSSQRLMTMKLTSRSISWLARKEGTLIERSWSPMSRARPTVRAGSPSRTVSHQPGLTRQRKARRKRLRTRRGRWSPGSPTARPEKRQHHCAAGELIGCDMQRGCQPTAGDHAVIRQSLEERQSVGQCKAEDEERRERSPCRNPRQPLPDVDGRPGGVADVMKRLPMSTKPTDP